MLNNRRKGACCSHPVDFNKDIFMTNLLFELYIHFNSEKFGAINYTYESPNVDWVRKETFFKIRIISATLSSSARYTDR